MCPGSYSPLSHVCPSQAVSSDFNRIWVICCSNYQIALARAGNRNGGSRAVGQKGAWELMCSGPRRFHRHPWVLPSMHWWCWKQGAVYRVPAVGAAFPAV